MENKTTSELLDLLWKLENASENKIDWDKYGEALAELEKRPPFSRIIGTLNDPRDLSHSEQLEELVEDVKLLKRHKHDEKSGDVMVRI
jgi:hypothetical protein